MTTDTKQKVVASSYDVSEKVCHVSGHLIIIMNEDGKGDWKTRCNKCGLTLDEIRNGEMA
jgi:hypothetical protein